MWNCTFHILNCIYCVHVKSVSNDILYVPLYADVINTYALDTTNMKLYRKGHQWFPTLGSPDMQMESYKISVISYRYLNFKKTSHRHSPAYIYIYIYIYMRLLDCLNIHSHDKPLWTSLETSMATAIDWVKLLCGGKMQKARLRLENVQNWKWGQTGGGLGGGVTPHSRFTAEREQRIRAAREHV